MKYGIEMEPVAAKVYANTFGRNTYKVSSLILLFPISVVHQKGEFMIQMQRISMVS